jgi:ornithine cyclodeaminase
MRHFDAAAVRRALPWPALVAALREMFAAGCAAPLRHAHAQADGTLLLMPAWQEHGHPRFQGVKIVNVAPGNGARGLPAVHATYLLSDATTGVPLALLDGGELTDRRTAAASVLAGTFLARPDSATLLVIGTGKVARALAEAWPALFPIARVLVWGRDAGKAAALAAHLSQHGPPAEAVADRQAACAQADIVSCATLGTDVVLRGAWLRPGTHVDLVGAYRRDLREADADAVARSTLVLDTVAGGMAEAGDLHAAIAQGAVDASHVRADLAALCRGAAPGRTTMQEITMFKSVGAALEDLAAAMLCLGHAPPPPNG